MTNITFEHYVADKTRSITDSIIPVLDHKERSEHFQASVKEHTVTDDTLLIRTAMTVLGNDTNIHDFLSSVRKPAARLGVPFAGSVAPPIAWLLFSSGKALIIDVRTAEERKFVGHVPNTIHVPWMTGTNLTRNPRFTRELQLKAKKTDVILLLCRSGKRSSQAAEAATKAGFTNVFNISHGFEGDIDEAGHRGISNGWRHQGLPWKQD